MLNKKIDKEAYIAFITENKEMLYRVAFGYLHDETKSLDAVDEAVYQGYVHRNDLREPKFLKTWVTRILINECFKIIRNGKRELNMDVLPENQQDSVEDSIHIKLVINSLPEDLRKVIILRYFGGFTISETAEILGIPDGTVSTRTRKALEVLRVEISD
ncbi:MAG: sigma-70 family RNA polymerase sigma factor [Tissierellia bacterium]|nr:sigma-70 family RNA polymerase sigma factor [Tissierellia bacterium]MDD4436800.1 sigma-70 family RNA polymerase sigma factor [Tissierellia bacterium]